MDEEAFQNIHAAAQMHSSHSAGFIAMGEWPFQHQSSAPQQGFAAIASDSPSIGVNRSALGLFADPFPFVALGFGHWLWPAASENPYSFLPCPV